MQRNRYKLRLIVITLAGLFLSATPAHAIQLHLTAGGIITHQIGHTAFLISMIVLIFTIRGKNLETQKGWRMIQYAALFFILWNLDTLFAHFLDNQIKIVSTRTLSFKTFIVEAEDPVVAWIYYFLKLDHLLCVPAMFFLYRGLSELVKEQKKVNGARA